MLNLKSDFPILSQKINGHPLVYLDNAATTQKPQIVLDKIIDFYSTTNSNIHRGVHHLSERSSEAYENARAIVKDFINAPSVSEVIFTASTTDSINLVAASFGSKFVSKDDEIIITEMEHHSNLVPWQVLCEKTGAKLKVIPIDDRGDLQFDRIASLITDRTKLIALTHVSNVLGTINPVKDIINLAHRHNVPVLLDSAQAVQHFKIDVQELDCDFLVFSGHKTYAETGVGVLYGKEKWLDEMPPYRTGGGMVSSVSLERTQFAELPFKFEAGTGNYVAAISLGTAIEYLKGIGFENILEHESTLFSYALEKLNNVNGLSIMGAPKNRCSVVSFNLDNIHAYDAGLILSQLGIAVRTGTHCAEPLMQRLGIDGTIRVSFAFYNTLEDVDLLVAGIRQAQEMLL